MDNLIGKTFTAFKGDQPVPMEVVRVIDSIAYCRSLDLKWEIRTTTDRVKKIIKLQEIEMHKNKEE